VCWCAWLGGAWGNWSYRVGSDWGTGGLRARNTTAAGGGRIREGSSPGQPRGRWSRGSNPRHRPRPAGGWPRQSGQVLIAAWRPEWPGLTWNSRGGLPSPTPGSMNWRQTPGRDGPGASIGPCGRPATSPWLKPLCCLCRGQGLLAPGPFGGERLEGSAVQRAVPTASAGRSGSGAVRNLLRFRCRFEEARLGAPLWEALNVPVLQLLCTPRREPSGNATAIGLALSRPSSRRWPYPNSGRITTRVGPSKSCCAPIRADPPAL